MRLIFDKETHFAPGDSILVGANDTEGRRVTIELACKEIRVGGLLCDGYVKIPATEQLTDAQ